MANKANTIGVSDITVSDCSSSENSYSSPGVRFLRRQMIKIAAIHNDAKNGNSVRRGGMSEYQQHIDDLEFSYRKGVDTTRPLPIIEYMETPISTPNGVVLEYRMVDGHHRLKALANIGVKEYPCDVYEFDDNISKTLFQIQMNNHTPSKSNTEKDVVTIFSHLIKEKSQFLLPCGDIDMNALENALCQVTNLRVGTKKTEKVICNILNGSGTLTKHKNHTDNDGIKWISQNMSHRILGSKGGDLWIFRTGTWERTYQRMKRAIFNERKAGNNRIHDIILNLDIPLHGDVKKEREKMVKDIQKAFEVDCFITNGDNLEETMNKFFKISYAMPQIHGVEDMNTVIVL